MKVLGVGLLFALASAGPAFAQADAHPLNPQPHPTMLKFLAEIESGELEKAAKRIATVNDMFGRQRRYEYFTQAELVALLASCELSSHTSLKTAVSIEKTVWDCPGKTQYSMIFNHVGEDANPYLHVGRIETVEAQKAREEAIRKMFASGPPQPVAIRRDVPSETKDAFAERMRLEALEKARKRDVVGEAVLSGDLHRLAEFTNDATDVAYITEDHFFDVKIKHVNGFGWADLQSVLQRAYAELGKPVSVECALGEGRWAPQICEWQLENPENTFRAEMNFSGEGGSMNSIRVFRKTPEEAAELRQQAIDLGVIEG